MADDALIDSTVRPDPWSAVDGRHLRGLREAAGIDRVQLARQCTLSTTQLQQLEDGGDSAFYSAAIKLAAGLRALERLGGARAPRIAPNESESATSALPPVAPDAADGPDTLTHLRPGTAQSPVPGPVPSSVPSPLNDAPPRPFTSATKPTEPDLPAIPSAPRPSSHRRVGAGLIGIAVIVAASVVAWRFHGPSDDDAATTTLPRHSASGDAQNAREPAKARASTTPAPAAAPSAAAAGAMGAIRPTSADGPAPPPAPPPAMQPSPPVAKAPGGALNAPAALAADGRQGARPATARNRDPGASQPQAPAQTGCEGGSSSVIEATPPSADRTPDYVYLVTRSDTTICLQDAGSGARTVKLPGDKGTKLTGEPPFTLIGIDLADVEVYFQGNRIRAHPGGEAITLRLVPR